MGGGEWPRGDATRQLVKERSVVKLVEGEVKRTLEPFAIYERPRRIALLPALLTEEAGEITPSLKIKVRVIKDRYADRIAYLFDEADAKD